MISESIPIQNNDPASKAIAVTPSDTTNLGGGGQYPRGLYVGTGGDLTVVMPDGPSTAVVFKAVPTGTFMPIRAKLVKAATTAADIVALY